MAIGTPVNRGTAQTDTSQSTLPVTTTGAIASGSKIILSAGWRTATTLSSVAGGGLTWTIDTQRVNVAATQHAALISADAPSGLASGTTITLTFSGNTTAKTVSVEEVTGLAAQGSVFDKTTGADIASGTSFSSGSTATTAQADELLMGIIFYNAVEASTTWTGSFTALQHISTPTRSTGNAYRIVSSTGAYAATGTYPTSATANAIIGTYKMAAGGASVTGAAALTSTSASTTSGFASKTGAASVTGLGSNTTVGVVTRNGTAALTGTGVAAATGVRKVSGSAALTMLGSSLQVGYTTRLGQASLAGAGVLSATSTSTTLPITDTFTRTRASDWGMSDSGHLWVGQSDSGAAVQGSVDGAQGVQVIDRSTTAYRREYVAVNNTDVEALFRTCFTALPATGVSTLGVNLRLAPPPAASTSYYLCELRLSLAAALTTRIDVVNVGSATTIAAAVTVTSSYVAGDFYWIRFQCVGSTIRCRVWKDGTAEPSTWTRTATNSLVANGVRVALFNYPSVGTGTANAKYDDVLIAQASLGAAALTGTGTASATGVRKRSGVAAVTGAGTLSATGVVTSASTGSASLTATSTLTATGTRTRTATAALSATSSLVATGARTTTGQALLAVTGLLSATGTFTKTGSANLTGQGVLAASAATVTVIHGAAHLTTAGALSVTGSRTVYGEAHLVTPDPIPPVIIETTGGGGPILRIDLAPITGEAHLYATGILIASGDRLLVDDEEALRLAVELLL